MSMMRGVGIMLMAGLHVPDAAGAQSLLDRAPNVSGDWVGAPGTINFHFVHRFSVSEPPQRKVSNVPTFLIAAGLPHRILAGFNYSTNSTLAPGFPNEWEVFARWAPLSQDYGSPFDAGGQVGYNNSANGVDAEISLSKKIGITRVTVAGRALSNPFEKGNTRFAIASGATVRLGQYVALAGDLGSLTNRDSSERVAWSAGLHFAIPMTPHTVSLHVTNVAVGTLQGESRGSANVRYGFEFTIPLTLSRYFGKRVVQAPDSSADNTVVPSAALPQDTVAVPPLVATPKITPTEGAVAKPGPPEVVPATPARAEPAPAQAPAKTRKTAIKNISYLEPRIKITAGTVVEWTNTDPLPHSVTAVDKSFNSGLIQPGKSYRHTFTKPGRFDFFCTPHPFMKGTITVVAR